MTLAEIDSTIAIIKTAYAAVLSGKAYTLSTGGTSRSVTRQDMGALRDELRYWEAERARVAGTGGRRFAFGTPG